MATFTLDDWDYDDTSPDKYILNGWTGSTTETEIYIPGEYNGRQISLKDLKIFPSSMTHLELEEVNGKKVQLETTNLSESFRYRSKIIHIDLDLFSRDIVDRLKRGYEFLLPFYDYFLTLDAEPDPREPAKKTV